MKKKIIAAIVLASFGLTFLMNCLGGIDTSKIMSAIDTIPTLWSNTFGPFLKQNYSNTQDGVDIADWPTKVRAIQARQSNLTKTLTELQADGANPELAKNNLAKVFDASVQMSNLTQQLADSIKVVYDMLAAFQTGAGVNNVKILDALPVDAGTRKDISDELGTLAGRFLAMQNAAAQVAAQYKLVADTYQPYIQEKLGGVALTPAEKNRLAAEAKRIRAEEDRKRRERERTFGKKQ